MTLRRWSLVWVLAALVWAGLIWLGEADVALPAERLADAGSLGAPVLVLAGLTLALGRRWPRLGVWLGVVGVGALGAGVLGLGLVGLGLAAPRAEAVAAGSGPDVVLITLDTLRADHLGVSGGPVPTPNLDALAQSGARFTQAVSTAPLTLPAHASMLTGQSPDQHGARQNGTRLEHTTVVPRLREAGWATAAFLASQVLGRDSGLSHGFEVYADRWGRLGRLSVLPGGERLLGRGAGERRGDAVLAQALAWFGGTEGPRFLWVHLYDVHGPYRPPVAWMPPREAMQDAVAVSRALARPSGSAREWMEDMDRRQAQGQRLLYGAEVRWVDHLVGELLRGLPDDAVVLAVGDHGESLGEHGLYFNHGPNLHEPSTHVPLLLRWPGRVAPGTVNDALVSVQDVAGTLLAAVGLPTDLPTVLGAGREEVLQHSTGQQARRPTSGAISGAVRVPGGRVLSTSSEPAVWYDLGADPAEAVPLPLPPERAAQGEQARRLAGLERPTLDPEQLERLRGLGYSD